MDQNAPARKRTGPGPTPLNLRPRVNFGKLDIASLRRYSRVHKLVGVPQTATKDQLVAAVTRHFAAQVVNDELKVIAAFVTAVQRRQSLAQQPGRK
ncbi:hypothetical protein VOLCADRAFT_120172 [Volvox carteri f. nagariensis]|uniref:Histone deacetylase complex subunit SAP30 Sin3 binding domain-containing protein n=1 Tax=Volvox carteri f. nagariensis TaxID=3068 RepID=D8THI4_VOLCA|nr:uncharacterized protein VOLCADRAFT_120172 [Volvox carteri f. nagariensis]EFJ53076.1 hypothetical protein VOLCADRAFT_120172 [Volvox carteri f. nagariensis]|eukprot:XP_002946081.1 hypothetical protein VOLCADRAFT_120172 [Volvox carteri f. nagariensis]